MNKKIIAAAAVLLLIGFAGGFLRSDAPARPTEPSTITAAVREAFAEPVHETTAASSITTEPAGITEAENAAASAATEEQTSPAPTTASAARTTAVSSTAARTSASATDTQTTPSESTDAAAAASAAALTQTTRQKLIDKLRGAGDRKKAPKPDPAFFDDAVFVGDSVTMGLRNYATNQRNKSKQCLGSAQFLCFGSMSYSNVLGPVQSGSMHPTYKGKKVRVEDGIQLCGAKKVFIMLGMNDFSAYSEKTWKQNVSALLDRIEEKNPGAAIYLESVTPILNGMEHGRFNNTNVQNFNAYLAEVCSDRGYVYVDIYHVLADDSGHLKQSYCGDPGAMGIHMSAGGCAAWAKYLQDTFCGA